MDGKQEGRIVISGDKVRVEKGEKRRVRTRGEGFLGFLPEKDGCSDTGRGREGGGILMRKRRVGR